MAAGASACWLKSLANKEKMSEDNCADLEVEAAWAAEIERRVEEIQSGEETGIPAAQGMKEARRALHEARRVSSPRRK